MCRRSSGPYGVWMSWWLWCSSGGKIVLPRALGSSVGAVVVVEGRGSVAVKRGLVTVVVVGTGWLKLPRFRPFDG